MSPGDARGAPLWIPTPSGQAFAWLHAPGNGRKCLGAVLLCDPFGWNRMVLHRTYRDLAIALADAGYCALRMDYPGTCDSEGRPRELARLEPWLASLEVAAGRLRAWSGTERIAAFGMLLGGTLAALLAARRPEVSHLILWGPYVRGRTAVRTELAATSAAALPRPNPPTEAGDREALGFLLSAGMISDLEAVRIAEAPLSGVRQAMIVGRGNDAAAIEELLRALKAGGAACHLHPQAPEDLEALLQSAGAGTAPQTIGQVLGWLRQAGDDLMPVRDPIAIPPSGSVTIPGASGMPLREEAVWLGRDAGLFGILTEPESGLPRDLGVVLASGGHNHRAGINRNYTEWARLLAARGHRVLRLDLRGLGDSPSLPGQGADLYGPQGARDIVDAVQWLRERGAGRVACVGLCAGGFQSLHAALSSASIDAVLMLNPLRYHDERPGEVELPAARLLRRAIRRLVPWASRSRRSEAEIARLFLRLAERGTDVRILYNVNEPTVSFIRRVLQPAAGRLEASGRFGLETVSTADHIFSPLHVQAEVTERVLAHVERLALEHGTRASETVEPAAAAAAA